MTGQNGTERRKNGAEQPPAESPRVGRRQPRVAATILFEAAVLSGLWLLFSWRVDGLHLAFGLVSVVGVLLLTGRLVGGSSEVARSDFLQRVRWHRIAIYPFWLLWKIAYANLQVAWMILHPRMPIDPLLLAFDSGLETELGQVTLGNSITLTPGTLTLHMHGQRVLVHALSPTSCTDLEAGEMPRVVAAVFGEEPVQDVAPRRMHRLDEIEPELRP
jgi:multicomponent Na+:H+ antiporter subunit E